MKSIDFKRKVEKSDIAIGIAVLSIIVAIICCSLLYAEVRRYNALEDEYKFTAIHGQLSDDAKAAAEIVQLYEDNYIGDLEVEDIYDFMVMATGDKYGTYFNKEATKDTEDRRSGEFVGIGVSMKTSINGAIVDSVIAGGPAEKAGIKMGDIITSVDDKNCEGKTAKEVSDMIRGDNGTSVLIGVDRDGAAIVFDIVRSAVKMDTVIPEKLTDTVGRIKISSFGYNTGDEIISAIDDLKKQGVENIVFDLRDNGGGVVDSATKALDYILGKCEIVRIKYKGQDEEEVINSDAKQVSGLNFVCLVNENTASAAELFTLSLRDNAGIKVVGVTTYGKGTILSVYELSNGGSLNVSTGKYSTEKSSCIEGIGIEPDIKALDKESSNREDAQLGVAVKQFN